MDVLVSVAQIVVCLVPLAWLCGWLTSRGTVGIQGLARPWRPDPWPVGVQEEDPDAPWGHGDRSLTERGNRAATTASLEELPAGRRGSARPDVARLHGSVHRPH